jgi:hypothetical protein
MGMFFQTTDPAIGGDFQTVALPEASFVASGTIRPVLA